MSGTRKFVIGLALAGLFSGPGVAEEGIDTPGWLKKDLAEFAGLIEGRWDNDRHVFFAEDAGMNPAQIAPRQHLTISRVMPAYSVSPPDGVMRFESRNEIEGGETRILGHQISIDPASQMIVQTLEPVAGEAGALAADCHVAWSRSGVQFEGQAVGAGCATLLGADGVSFTLSKTELWVAQNGPDGRIEARMRKARPFECWTAILRDASHGDSGAGSDDWWFRRGVKLHDQGGVAVLETDEQPPREVRLKLRDVDWPYGSNRPSLTLYVYEGDSDRAVSYAWGEASAERIGINLRWIQASCAYTPDKPAD